MTDASPYEVPPGTDKEFYFFGMASIYDVTVTNLSGSAIAWFQLHSGTNGWTYHGSVEPGGRISLRVSWASDRARFTNNSNATIRIGGESIGVS